MQFPAGFYCVGDPCYAFPDDNAEKVCGLSWDEVCDQVGAGELEIFIPETNLRIFASNTTFGDGMYSLDFHRPGSPEYLILEHRALPVDSGLIGIFSRELVEWAYESAKQKGQQFDPRNCYSMVAITEPFEVWLENGILRIGKCFRVETGEM